MGRSYGPNMNRWEDRMSTEIEISILPDVALERLKEGNERFVSEERTHFHTGHERRVETLRNGQHPLATVLACSDSRVPVEMVFDQGIGDIFVVRLIGNVCNNVGQGCIEYAVEHLRTPLLVILGHTDCGAVKAVVEREKLHGNMSSLLTCIIWAVGKTRKKHPELSGNPLLAACIEANVWQSVEDLFKGSRMVCRKIRNGELRVVGAIYDLESGCVNWLGEHPNQIGLI